MASLSERNASFRWVATILFAIGIVSLTIRVASAALPIPPPPPYDPQPMGFTAGLSGLVVYNNTNGVAILNPSGHTISPILLNQFDYSIDPDTGEPVGGQLGSEGGGRYDLAMTSDAQLALISNFGDRKIFFVDLSTGTPQVAGMAQIDLFAEDIAIDPTNQWALVTDGSFTPQIAVLHLPSRSWVPAGQDPITLKPVSYEMPDERYANTVAIAPDGRTVIVADYFQGIVHVLLFNPTNGELTYKQSVQLWKYGTDETAAFPFLYRPVNLAISPDGRTVIVVSPNRSTEDNPDPDPDAFYEGSNIAVLIIDQPGHVVRQPDVIMPWRVGGAQSVVFSADGSKAYVETIYYDDEPLDQTDVFWRYQEIQELTITSPGQVHHTRVVRSPTPRGTSQLFGVDILAITPDGRFLYATNPTSSKAQPVIDVFDLVSFTHIKSIGTPQHYPDPRRNWPDEPLPPDPNNPDDWIPNLYPVGIAFPPLQQVSPVPTMSGWALLLLMAMLAGGAARKVAPKQG